ncbi:zinc finger CCCH domain-containing protein [Musa troglodytarum]|nr:zinc finger CCCH domain-containing protein [Musa troglodytarum]
MLYNSSSGQELLLRRKLEEQQQALELQQAIELHARRLMNLQLLDLKNRTLCSSAPAAVNSPTIEAAPAITIPTADTPSSSGSGSGSSSSQEQSPTGGELGHDEQIVTGELFPCLEVANLLRRKLILCAWYEQSRR